MYNVIPTETFKKDIKYYETKKKYKHINDDINAVVQELKKGNLVGEELGDLHLNDENNKIIKVRVANSDTNVGKSNGYRIIYYAIKEDLSIYLLSVYYKKDDIRVLSDDEIIRLVKDNCL